MLRGLFVTGTDTDVGKTIVAASLMHRYRGHAPLRYWKPIQTGIEQDDDATIVLQLGDCDESEVHRSGVRLTRPLAPYLSAKLNNVHITVADLIGLVRSEGDQVRWIAEGAGGVLVPINESESMVDLIAALGMPVLIAARSALGTINHTLLTIETLRRRNLQIAGVVMIGNRNPGNRDAIERYGDVPVVAEMPRFPALTADCLGRWSTSEFDTPGLLARYFR